MTAPNLFTNLMAQMGALTDQEQEAPTLRCMLMRNPDGTLLREGAMIPTRGSAKAIGMDLYIPQTVVVPAHSKVTVPIGVAVAVPEGHYGRIAPKSGTSHKLTMMVAAGVIDEDYRGELGVILVNYGAEPITFEGGKAAAQLIMERASIIPVTEVQSLDETERGDGGFGSTGAGVGGGSMDATNAMALLASMCRGDQNTPPSPDCPAPNGEDAMQAAIMQACREIQENLAFTEGGKESP